MIINCRSDIIYLIVDVRSWTRRCKCWIEDDNFDTDVWYASGSEVFESRGAESVMIRFRCSNYLTESSCLAPSN